MYAEPKQIYCPYCGESISVMIDDSVQVQQYIEDCSVCCRPIELKIVLDNGEALIFPKRDDE